MPVKLMHFPPLCTSCPLCLGSFPLITKEPKLQIRLQASALLSFGGLGEDIQCPCDNHGEGLGIERKPLFALIQQPQQGPAHAAGAVRPDRISGNAFESLGQHADEVQMRSLGWHEKSAPGAGRTRNHQIRRLDVGRPRRNFTSIFSISQPYTGLFSSNRSIFCIEFYWARYTEGIPIHRFIWRSWHHPHSRR